MKKHPLLTAHHRYQLEVIFLFIFGFFLSFPYFLFWEEYGLDQNRWQWYFFWPWMTLYIGYSLYTRDKIPTAEKVNPLSRGLWHWTLLGLTVLAANLGPTDLRQLQSIDLGFAVLSVLLADSYWDFRKTLK